MLNSKEKTASDSSSLVAKEKATSSSIVTATSLAITLTDLTPDEKRELLFDVDRSLEIPIDDFNENWWPLVSNIWTKWNLYKQVNGDIWKVFGCRFMKFRESSTRQKENIPNEKGGVIHFFSPSF